MNSQLKNVLKYLIFIGIGGTLLYLAFRNTEFEKLVSDLKKARYEYVIASMIMGYLAFVSRGIRWKYLIDPMGFKASTWNSIHAITMGYFTNSLIPRAGELARCTALNQTDKIPVNRLFGTVIIERIVDLIMLVSLGSLAFILEYDKFLAFFDTAFKEESTTTIPEESNSLAWKLLIGSIILGILIVIYFFRSKFNHHPAYHKVRDFWNGIKEGLRSFSKIENKIPFILHTLFIWGMYFFMSYIVMFSLDATSHINMSSGLFVVTVAALGIIAPSPGGIGTFHYFAMLGMGMIGVAADDALSFATLTHSGQTVMTILSGLISMAAIYRIRKRRKDKNLTELSNG